MIRPEQVVMSGASGTGCKAVVVATDFAGAQCMVTLEIEGTDRAPMRILLHASPYNLPEQGETVWLSVRGPVHPVSD